MLKLFALGAVGSLALLPACIHRSGGTWMVESAPLPEGWPELSPVGEVSIREYPAYRAASVSDVSLDEPGMGPMFKSLFRHISSNDIAMTAPVDMGYQATENGRPGMDRMAFLYRNQSQGQTGQDGPVVVEDIPPSTFASVGLRGGYSDRNYRKGLAILDEYLAQQPQWRPAGEPRYLGYNGPFTLWFLRYGEVQVQVEPGEHPAD